MSENPKKNSLFCFGLGFAAQALVKRMRPQGWNISGTCRAMNKEDLRKELSVLPFDGTHATEEIRNALSKATHLLVSIPPQPSGDVVLQNFRPGVADRLGIGYAGIAATNPRVVYLSISGFGQTGPNAGRRAYDPIIQMYSGLADVQGLRRGEGREDGHR